MLKHLYCIIFLCIFCIALLSSVYSQNIIRERPGPTNNEPDHNEFFETSKSETVENQNEYVGNSVPNFKNLPDCSKKQKESHPVILLSTLDSYITGISYRTGEILWSHKTGAPSSSLLSSSMSNIEVECNGEIVRLIPSLEGNIYKFDGESVEPLPFNADSLLQSSFKFNDDTVITGGKFSDVMGVLPNSGTIKYKCDATGCPITTMDQNLNPVVVVRRVSHTVRAVDPKTGLERWNFSVGRHLVNAAGAGCESSYADDEGEGLPSIHFVLPSGVVIALSDQTRVVWKQKLPSPIVSAWSVINGVSSPINLFSSNSVPALVARDDDLNAGEAIGPDASLYVGVHKKQLYILVNDLLKAKSDSNKDFSAFESFKTEWLPYSALAYRRTPAITEVKDPPNTALLETLPDDSNALTLVPNLDYSYDNGFFLYDDHDSLLANSSVEFEEMGDPSWSDSIYFYYFSLGRTFWWTALAGVLIYSTLHVLVFRYLFSIALNNVESDVNRRIITVVRILMHNILREHPQLLVIIQRLGLNIPRLPPPPPQRNGLPAEPKPPERQDSAFVSRYEADFEPVRCLGRGGFGVVFHAKNRLDENQYAVKRILLPAKETSAERVKREVRALAKLSHPNIVRYYNSWLETPPPGWAEHADSWWKQNDTFTESLLSNEQCGGEALSGAKPKNDSVRSSHAQSLSGVIKKLNANPLHPASTDLGFDVCRDFKDSSSLWDSGQPESDGDESDDERDSSDSVEVLFSNNNNRHSGLLSNSKPYQEEDSIVFENVDMSLYKGLSNSNPASAPLISSQSSNNSSFSTRNQDESIVFEKCDMSSYNCQSTANPDYSYLKPSVPIRPQRNKSSSFSLGDSKIDAVGRKPRTSSLRIDIDSRSRPSTLDFATKNSKDLVISTPDSLKNDSKSRERVIIQPSPKTYLYIQMELCHKESLRDWLFNNPRRAADHVYQLFNDIVNAVEYVHDRSLMHRDLKPSNIFFSLEGEIKIGDFGLVTSIEDESLALTPMVDSTNVSSVDVPAHQRTLNAGTHLYMSPEQMQGKSYNYKVDIYSLGLILFEMLEPFSTEMERRKVMLMARERKFPNGFTQNLPEVGNLLDIALHPSPEKRPTTRGIRVRAPLSCLQKDLHSISAEEHFSLSKVKGHVRSSSGTYSSGSSLSSNYAC